MASSLSFLSCFLPLFFSRWFYMFFAEIEHLTPPVSTFHSPPDYPPQTPTLQPCHSHSWISIATTAPNQISLSLQQMKMVTENWTHAEINSCWGVQPQQMCLHHSPCINGSGNISEGCRKIVWATIAGSLLSNSFSQTIIVGRWVDILRKNQNFLWGPSLDRELHSFFSILVFQDRVSVCLTDLELTL